MFAVMGDERALGKEENSTVVCSCWGQSDASAALRRLPQARHHAQQRRFSAA